MADSSFKTRENRIRRMAERQGLTLTKSRRRDPRAVEYGRYYILRDGIQVLDTTSLADVERFLTQ